MPLSRKQRDTVSAVRTIWERYVREFVVPGGEPVDPVHLRAFLANLNDGDLMTMAQGMSLMISDRAEQELQFLAGCAEVHRAAVRLIESTGTINVAEAVRVVEGLDTDAEVDEYRIADVLDRYLPEDATTAPTGRIWSSREVLFFIELESAEAAGL